MTDEGMVERVARTLCRAQGLCKYAGDKCNTSRCSVDPEIARAAIAAMREPTVEMAEAGFNAKPIPSMRAPATHYYLAWKAMIDAALQRSPEAE